MNDGPTEGRGRNTHRGREPTRNHRDGGERNTPQEQTESRPTEGPTPRTGPRVTLNRSRMTVTPQPPPETPRPRNQPNETLHQPRRKRQDIKIASLNVRGKGNRTQDKWGSLRNVMKRRQIAVASLQETHANDEMQQDLARRFRNTLYIVHSADTENPGTTGGVSVAIDKKRIDVTKVTHRIVVPGRVIMIEIPWCGEDRLKIMNVYAPAKNAEKPSFWETLADTIAQDETLTPDVLMGDLNLTESPEIDRLQGGRGADPPNAQQALSNLMVETNQTDGWRRRNPKKRGYTYFGRGESRIDRIYVKEDLYPWCKDWRIEHPGLETDHHLVSVNVTSENMPYLGKGRWMIPIGLLRDKHLKKETQKLARKMRDRITDIGDRRENPQVALKTFKNEVVALFRDYQRTNQPKIENRLRSLRKELENKADTPSLTNETIHEESLLLSERINALERKQRDGARLLHAARNRLEGETMSKHWTRSAKENTPRDTIRALKNPLLEDGTRQTRSDKMAELARDYHAQLLRHDRDPQEEPNNERLNEALRTVEARLSQKDSETLKEEINEKEVAEALMKSANDKAAGLDGIPTELWKLLHQQFRSAKDDEKTKYCNISAILAVVYNDISRNGIAEGTNFNEGWMCPIYKKKEADNIANYRPITVLNTDYKILAKVLTTRLNEVAPNVIHPDQAGFIRGRSIFDQIEQAATAVNYAKIKGINGAIVALDQEKAYDKVLHPYLWKVLEHLAFPPEFIKTVKILYQNAPTSVIINGVISSPFIVSRGVRQGDPMSCILFDIGIEPLAAKIRASNIKGIDVPNLDDKVKVSLFADDTTVILTENDSFRDLINTLEGWCAVSGAKFNVEKTELIPLGTEEYRARLAETRRLNDTDDPVPTTIHIAGDHESTRILGAWIGNNTNPQEPWKNILDTIRKDFRRWETRYPTLNGKRLIVQMVAGGKTQFLARAQGMPGEIEKELQKEITKFVWGKERAVVCIDDMAKAISGGGGSLLNVAKRNEAIDLMWIKQYLNMGPDRPKWAYMMDEIFRMQRPKKAKESPEAIQGWNPLTQNWKPKRRTENIPARVQKALRLAEKYGVSLEAPNPTEETKRELPVWLHKKANKDAARIYKTQGAKCLKETHRTHYLRQLVDLIENVPEEHRETNYCTCGACRKAFEIGCAHPNRCLETATRLIQAIAPGWRPNTGQPTERTHETDLTQADDDLIRGVVIKTTHEETDLKQSIRIFTEAAGEPALDAPQTRNETNETTEELTIYTDGSCTGNGSEDARTGSGVWYGHGDPRNAAIRVPGEQQTNQVGELLAILHAVKEAPTNRKLRICSDSRFALDGLTKWANDWEGKGWLGVTHGPLFKCITAWSRKRTAETTLQWVKGHSGVEGNEEADKLAAEGAEKEAEREDIDITMPEGTVTTGSKLAETSQKLIYAHIAKGGRINRAATRRSIEKIKTTTQNLFGYTPTEGAIWKSIRHKDVSKKIRDFLWKHAHGAYMLGSTWAHIPGYEDRAICNLCDEQEDLNHIMTRCQSAERRTIWGLASEIWSLKHGEALQITEGAILGGGLATFSAENGNPDAPKNRFYKILMTESTHLIWVLRCERRISREGETTPDPPEAEIRTKWLRKMNERMQIDCLLTNQYLYERKALKTRLVYETWKGVSTNTTDLHREWCRHPGVLVGMTQGRSPERNRHEPPRLPP